MIFASVMPLAWIQGSLVGDGQCRASVGKARPRAQGRWMRRRTHCSEGQAGCTHRGNDENRKKPVRWKRFAPWFRNASCPSRTCSLPAAPRRRASWPCPDSTPSPRDGCSPDRPRQAAELDQRQEPQAIPDRKGQKLGGVQPIHQARRCAPSLGGASSPRGACAPGAFSLEIAPSELDHELGGLEATQARGLQACDVGLFATAPLSHVFSCADIISQ